MTEQFFKQLIHSSTDGVFAFDTECRYTEWNPAMERLFDISRDDVLGNYAFELFPFLKEIGEDKYYSEALAGQTVIAKKRPYTIPKTGQPGFFEAHYSPIYDDSGNVSGGMAIVYDITEAQQPTDRLVQNATRNQALLHAIPDLVLSIRKDGTYLDFKAARAFQTVVPPDEFLGKTEYEVMPAHIAEERMRHVERALETGKVEIFEYELPLDGEVHYEEARIVASGEDEALILVRDITERKRAEAEIRQRNRELTALQFTAATITSDLDFQSVLNSVTREMANLLGVSACAISTWDQTDNTVSLIAEYGPDDWWDEEEFQKPFSLADFPLTKRVLVERHAQQITVGQPDVDPAELEYMQQVEIKTLLMLPMEHQDRVVGLVELMDDQTERTFTYAEIGLAQMLTNQATIAIENARLYEQAQRDIAERKRIETAERQQRELAEALYEVTTALNSTLDLDELLERILINVERVVPHDAADIMLLEDGAARIVKSRGFTEHQAASVIGRQFPLNDSPEYRQMIETGQPLITADVRTDPTWIDIPGTEWIRSYIGAPISSRDEVVGFINLTSATTNFFTTMHAEHLLAFTHQAGIAIGNSRLFEAARQRAEQLEALRQVSEDLTVLRDLDTLLSQIVERAIELFDAGGGGIHLYRPERQLLEWAVATENYSDAIGRTLSRGEGVSGKVWETGDPLIIDDYHNWSGKSSQWNDIGELVVGVPIQWGDDFLGVLNLWTEKTRSHFTADDLPLLSQFASQAAIAINNAQLFEVTRQRIAVLEAVRQASLSLTSSLELQQVLEAILDSMLNLLTDIENAHIFLYRSDHLAFGAALWHDGRQGQPFAEPRPHGLSYSVAKQGRLIVVPDMRTHPLYADAPSGWDGAIIGLPLKIGQRVVGVMNAFFSQAGERPAPELRILELLADQAAIAIENARLHEETEHSLTQITRLYELSMEFASSLNVQDAADLVIKKVVQATKAHSAVLNLLDEAGNLELAIAPPDEDSPRPSGTTMTIFKSGQPLVISDTEQESGIFSSRLRQKGIRASIGLPLKAEARTMGVLFVRYEEPHHFSEREIEMLFIFANQAAIAIQNARWYEQAQREIVERKRAEAALRKSEQELQTIFNSITDYIWSAEVIDGQVQYRYYSPIVEQITGYSPEYFLTGVEAWLDIVHPDDRVQLEQDLARELSGELVVEHEYRIIRSDGEIRWLFGTSSPTLDESGNVIRLDGVVSDVTDRKQAEAALQESEERFRGLFQSSPDGIILIDPHSQNPDWAIIDCNETACRMNGYERSELIGQSIDILNLKPGNPQERADYLDRLRREGHIYVESYHRHKDGTVFPIEISTTLISLSGQEIVLGIDRDITERKEAEQALAEERKLLRTLIDNLPDMIYFKDTESRFILGNMALAQIMGAETPEDLIGKTDFDFYPEELAAQYYADDQLVIQSGQPLINREEPIIDSDGTEGWISTIKVPLFDNQGQVTGLVGMSRDITERKQVEAELKSYRERLETLVKERTADLEQAIADVAAARDRIDAILHSVADGLIVTDLEHRIILANPAAADLLGLPLEEMLGCEIGDCIRDDRLHEIVGTILNEQKDSYEDDIELTDPATQRTRVMRARTAMVHNQQEQPMGTVTIIQDVTRLREVDRLKTELLTTAAHELRTPLTSIMGFSEILLNRELNNTRQQRYLTMISDQSNHLAQIIDDLLDVSRLESGRGLELNRERVDLGELMAEVVLPFAETATEHDIRMEGLAGLPTIEGDPFRLAQVGRNLLSNAIKYSTQGGAIIIRGQTMADLVEISIQDEGIGMSLEQQEHLFEPFYRADSSHTAVSGTGLGLAISRLIVEQHGGEIWLESEQTKGTIVHFTLPLDQAQG